MSVFTFFNCESDLTHVRHLRDHDSQTVECTLGDNPVSDVGLQIQGLTAQVSASSLLKLFWSSAEFFKD